MDRELTLSVGQEQLSNLVGSPLNAWGPANGHYSLGPLGRDGISMHLDTGWWGQRGPPPPPTEVRRTHRGAHYFQPPLGSLGPSLAWESQLRVEAALCPAFSSACDPSGSYQNLWVLPADRPPEGQQKQKPAGKGMEEKLCIVDSVSVLWFPQGINIVLW